MALELPLILPRSLPRTQADWQQHLNSLQQLETLLVAALTGYTGTITTASLGSSQGSMTFVDGVLTAQTPAT